MRLRCLSVLISLAACFFCWSCQKNPVSPEQKNPVSPEPTKSIRNYTWSRDTIPNAKIQALWGSSPKDVYAICGVGYDPSQPSELIWRFDGKMWAPVSLPVTSGTFTQLPVRWFSSVYGFGPSDVWAVGARSYSASGLPADSSLVLHYDGSIWHEMSISGAKGLATVWGSAPNNVWIGSVDGIVYQFNGTTFRSENPPYTNERMSPLENFVSLTGRQDGTTFLLYGVDRQSTFNARCYLVERQTNGWTLIGNTISPYSLWGIWMSPGGSLFGYYPSLYKWQANSWMQLGSFDEHFKLSAMTGMADNDITVVGYSSWDWSSYAYNFDGASWARLSSVTIGSPLYAVWVDGTEAFMVAKPVKYGNWSIILHGK